MEPSICFKCQHLDYTYLYEQQFTIDCSLVYNDPARISANWIIAKTTMKDKDLQALWDSEKKKDKFLSYLRGSLPLENIILENDFKIPSDCPFKLEHLLSGQK